MSDDIAESLQEEGTWRTRDVSYWGGSVSRILPLLPTFMLENFVAGDGSQPNQYLKAVVRQPMTKLEKPVPVATVSNSYGLVQHRDVAQRCLDGIAMAGVEATELRCELGLTEYGEWMNLRLYFPDRYNYAAKDNEPLQLRLECFNSVDGWNRLVIFFGWLRFVCSNGMVFGEVKAETRQVHSGQITLDPIPFMIATAMGEIAKERKQLASWEATVFSTQRFTSWIDGPVTEEWGKKAACRVFHICKTGHDVEISDPFARGSATAKPVNPLAPVPGAVASARTIYDVCQALTYIATRRANAEERVEWQAAVPRLLSKLEK